MDPPGRPAIVRCPVLVPGGSLCGRAIAIRVRVPGPGARPSVRGRILEHLRTAHGGLTDREWRDLASRLADDAQGPPGI